MRKKRIKLIVTILLGLGLSSLQAQETTSTSGGDILGAGGSVSFTTGQLVGTPISGTTGSVTPGVQQPWEISIVNSISELPGINIAISAFPNPVTKILKLKVDHYSGEKLRYVLFDNQGKQIEGNTIDNKEISISVNNLAQSAYFLKVFENNKEVKNFKIIKN